MLLKDILTKNYRRVHDQKYSINMKPVLATVKRECIFLVVFFHQFLERLLKLLQRNNSIFLWYNEEDIDRIFLLTFELNKCQKKNLYFYQREFNERVEYMYVTTFTSAVNLEIEIQCYFHKPKRIVFSSLFPKCWFSAGASKSRVVYYNCSWVYIKIKVK